MQSLSYFEQSKFEITNGIPEEVNFKFTRPGKLDRAILHGVTKLHTPKLSRFRRESITTRPTACDRGEFGSD